MNKIKTYIATAVYIMKSTKKIASRKLGRFVDEVAEDAIQEIEKLPKKGGK